MKGKRSYFLPLLGSLLLISCLLLTACQSTVDRIPTNPTAKLSQPTFNSTVYTATAPAATATAVPSATSIPGSKSTPAWLAYIENGRLSIRNLSGTQTTALEGEYRELPGWSPGGAYLLAVRKDGASIVSDTVGKIQAVLDRLPQPAFWARLAVNDSLEDWLAVPKADGALELLSFPSGKTKSIYEPGSLGADGLASIRWGSNGEAILTPSLNQMENNVSFEQGFFAWSLQNGPDVQNLVVGVDGGFASADFHQKYFEVLDSVPGNSTDVLLGFVVENQCLSCENDGLELVSLDMWSENILDLGTVLLNTTEAYAWNPAQPGLLALAAGGSRFTLENKRLALLDVPGGSLRYLTGKDQVVFEPAWSPDGRMLAFTTLPARDHPSGSGHELETLLGGRAIAVYDLQSGGFQTLTHPAEDEIDGWPRWLAGGQTLLYARKQLANSTTQIRQLDLGSGQDQLVLTLDSAPQSCHRAGCGWEQILAYTPGTSAINARPLAPVLPPTTTAVVQTDTPREGLSTYHNAAYGFSFQYPAGWTLSEAPNFIQLSRQEFTLMLGYRRATQQARIQRTGTGAGDLVSTGSVLFMGKMLDRSLLVYQDKVKEVFYQGDDEFSVGDLVFTLGLDSRGTQSYEDADIPKDVQAEADRILGSFVLEPKGTTVP